MKVLLIWHEALEGQVKLYLIRNLSDEDVSILDEANGKYINCDDDEDGKHPIIKIWDRISNNADDCENKDDPNNCIWSKYLLNVNKDNKKPVLNESINRVYICGII
jgi:hypothetical protein